MAYAFLGGFLVVTLCLLYRIIVSSVTTRPDTLALPPVWMFAPTLEAYQRVFVDEQYGRYFLNATVIAAGTTRISLAVGSMAAYVLERLRFRLWNLFAYALLDTHLGLIIVYTTFSLPYAVWIMAGFFAAVLREIDEAAMVDGCSRFGAFCRVILPLAAPGVAAAIYILLLSWNKFIFALVLVGGGVAKTLPVAVAQRIGQREIQWNELCGVHGRDTAAPHLLRPRQQVSRAGDDRGRGHVVRRDVLAWISATRSKLLEAATGSRVVCV